MPKVAVDDEVVEAPQGDSSLIPIQFPRASAPTGGSAMLDAEKSPHAQSTAPQDETHTPHY